MQASKITPKTTYAIEQDGALQRFCVTAVVTTRKDNTGSPHDYQSKVHGFVFEVAVETLNDREIVILDPKRILGPFEDFAELRERQEREKAEVQRATDERKAAVQYLWSLLYAKTGAPPPNDPATYKQPFKVSYSGIEITGDGIKLLTELLEKR